MSSILDLSRIPPERLDDPRLIEWEALVYRWICNTKMRLATCVHEAGHEEYALRAGAERVSFHGPLVTYDCTTDSFDVGTAGIQPDFGTVAKPMDVSTMARWYVAGGVVQLVLTEGTDEGGDGQDFEVFSAECRSRLSVTLTEEQIAEFWERAQDDVKRDLRSPVLRQLWKRAREFDAVLQELFRATPMSQRVRDYLSSIGWTAELEG